jgi:hypothetical protein
MTWLAKCDLMMMPELPSYGLERQSLLQHYTRALTHSWAGEQDKP